MPSPSRFLSISQCEVLLKAHTVRTIHLHCFTQSIKSENTIFFFYQPIIWSESYECRRAWQKLPESAKNVLKTVSRREMSFDLPKVVECECRQKGTRLPVRTAIMMLSHVDVMLATRTFDKRTRPNNKKKRLKQFAVSREIKLLQFEFSFALNTFSSRAMRIVETRFTSKFKWI